jgi:hypothetical protein
VKIFLHPAGCNAFNCKSAFWTTGPVSDDLHLRAYYKEWKRLMSAELNLTVE